LLITNETLGRPDCSVGGKSWFESKAEQSTGTARFSYVVVTQ